MSTMTPAAKLRLANRLPWLINYRQALEGNFLWECFNSIPEAKRNQPIADDDWEKIKKHDAPPRITFSHLGFASADVFLIKCERQLMVGSLTQRLDNTLEFHKYDFFFEHYVGRLDYIGIEEVPTPEAIIAEYIKQLADKGIAISDEIIYAG